MARRRNVHERKQERRRQERKDEEEELDRSGDGDHARREGCEGAYDVEGVLTKPMTWLDLKG